MRTLIWQFPSWLASLKRWLNIVGIENLGVCFCFWNCRVVLGKARVPQPDHRLLFFSVEILGRRQIPCVEESIHTRCLCSQMYWYAAPNCSTHLLIVFWNAYKWYFSSKMIWASKCVTRDKPARKYPVLANSCGYPLKYQAWLQIFKTWWFPRSTSYSILIGLSLRRLAEAQGSFGNNETIIYGMW